MIASSVRPFLRAGLYVFLEELQGVRSAHDLPAAWNAPTADTRTKQRLIHILIQEIVCDLDEAANEVVLLIHWTGGRHSELRVPRVRTGCCDLRPPAPNAVEAIRKLATRWGDRDMSWIRQI